jgi:Gpi18-like mannosyltransferase
MILNEKRPISVAHILKLCAPGLLFVLAIVLRASLYHVITSDYTVFVSRWYEYIKTHNGFAAFKDDFYNYNPPYLYLLALATYVPVPELVAIKTISVIFDLVLGIFTYLIISLKYQRSYAAVVGALVVLFAPTIFINSSAWGQCDAIYTSFCLGSLYFILKGRPGWACAFFGIAFAFKLQAIFFFPVLLILLLQKKLPVQYLVYIPLIFALALVPAFIAGRSIPSLLSIYTQQIETGGVGGAGGGFTGQFRNQGSFSQANRNGYGYGHSDTGTSGQSNGGTPGQFGGSGQRQFGFGSGRQRQFGGGGRGNGFSSSSLTYNAPTIYQWLSTSDTSVWKWVGIILAGLVVVVVGVLVLMSKEQLTPAIILKIAVTFAVAIPFFLPEMHERYFYLADVLSIAYAFYFPMYFFVPLIVQFSSLSSYAPYMLNNQVVNLGLVAFFVFCTVVFTMTDLVLTLYPNLKQPQTPDEPANSTSLVRCVMREG